MEKSQHANTSGAYSSNNPEPPSVKESEEETSLRSAAEYDLKEKVTPS